MAAVNAEDRSDKEWLEHMDWHIRKPLFDEAIAKHYPTLSGKYQNDIPTIFWDAPKESSEDDKWLFDNESAAEWDLIKNGPTGEIWCKFIRLLAPISWDPGGDWDKWKAAGLPLPPRPANLPAPVQRIVVKELGNLGFIA